MRIIKFRGKSIDGKEWLYGDLVSSADKKRFAILVNDKETYDECEIVPETIGQFTGLMDKNGAEIYEGDIIGCHNPRIKHLIFYNEKQGRFMAALNGDIENDFVGVCGLDDSRWTCSKTVIGNVYDNPELLKEESH